ncbi:MAG: hypothetical protein FWF17_08325 [Betaproteobacteria bacterium]|nr:hypothetical protein [Betaproteobacteria bacterium]
MSYNKDQIFECYKRLGSIKGVCVETGCPPYIAYIWLRKAKLLRENDKQQYGTSSSKLGAAAEAEFQQLVPEAMAANINLEPNNPSFDFMVGDLTIDVKYSSIRPSDGRWGFNTARNKALVPDLYCAFFATAPGGKLKDGYHLLLIPHEMLCVKDPVLRPDDRDNPLWQFAIEPAALRSTLLSMAR